MPLVFLTLDPSPLDGIADELRRRGLDVLRVAAADLTVRDGVPLLGAQPLTGHRVFWRNVGSHVRRHPEITAAVDAHNLTMNSIATMQVCRDKRETFRVLSAAGVPTVPTSLIEAGARVPEGFVAKPALGERGRDIIFGPGTVPHGEPYVIQPNVGTPEDFARALVVGGEVALSYRRLGAVLANTTQGAYIELRELTAAERDVAVSAHHAVAASWSGIDLVLGDEPSVMEANSSAALPREHATPFIDALFRLASSPV